MPKHPTVKALRIERIIGDYGATYFREALARFVVTTSFPTLTSNQIEYKACGILLPTTSIPVFHTMKFVDPITGSTLDAAHAKPAWQDRQQRPVPGQFDTVLVKVNQKSDTGIQGQPPTVYNYQTTNTTLRPSCGSDSCHIFNPTESLG